MRLTKRQQEFLNCIFDQYLKHRNPVHYTTVAKKLGVSKWTAYDMLKRLGEKGYLSSHYGVKDKGNPGRSQLYYTPTSKLQQLMEENTFKTEDWLVWRQRLVNCVNRLQSATGSNRHTLMEELLSLLPESKGSSIMYCAGLIALFVAYIKVCNEQGMKLVRQVIDLIKKPEQRLSLFSGTILGILSRGPEGTTAGEKEGMMAGFVNNFHRHLAGIDLKQHRLLAGFLSDLLQVVS